MKLIDFLWALIHRFLRIDADDSARLKQDLKDDWAIVRTPDESDYDTQDSFNKIKGKVKHLEKDPWVRVGFALLFILAQRWISDYLNPRPEPNENESTYP